MTRRYDSRPTKHDSARRLAMLMAPRDAEEQRRLMAWHMSRTKAQVLESLGNWLAVSRVTDAEAARHCQLGGLPKIGR